MRPFALLAVMVAGCATQPAPEKPKHILVSTCPAPPESPKPLGKLVTIEGLRAWGEEADDARKKTADALKVCARRLQAAVEQTQR